MKILMLAQFYAPVIGGEERHVQDLSHALVERGHEVAVASFWQPGLPEFEIERGVRLHRIRSTTQSAGWLYVDPGRRHAPPFPDPGAVRGLRKVIEREQPEIVHAHNWLLYSFLPLKRWSKAGLVVTLHDYSLLCAKKRLMKDGEPCSGPSLGKCLKCAVKHYGPFKGIPTALTKRAMRTVEHQLIDRFLAVSHATAVGNGLVGSGLPYDVIPNFVPEETEHARGVSHPLAASLPEQEYLLFVGDLSHEKGVHILLRAYAGLRNAPPLVLIGRRCLEFTTGLPPNVLFLNHWPHEAIMEAWRRSSLAVVPSIWPEPFGIVAIEAMAAGLPVIASRIGGLPDIVADGETGFLVPSGDVEALRQAIQRLVDNPALRARMGQAASLKVAEFKASAVVPRIEGVYQAVREEVKNTPGAGK